MTEARQMNLPRANPLFLRDADLREALELLFFGYRDFTKRNRLARAFLC